VYSARAHRKKRESAIKCYVGDDLFRLRDVRKKTENTKDFRLKASGALQRRSSTKKTEKGFGIKGKSSTSAAFGKQPDGEKEEKPCMADPGR